MDLIYRDNNDNDVGVITGFQFDLAYGIDENDFSFEIPLSNHCCKQGYFLYIEDTEYGGIIDKIEVDTLKQVVTYYGRTWHGILDSIVVEPESGQDYRIVSGTASSILDAFIRQANLTDIFLVDMDIADIYIYRYQFQRYVLMYSGICSMLKANNAKLQLTFDGKLGKVILRAIPLYNYANDEEWSSDIIDFKSSINYMPVNHLICLGGGNLSERHVIHLFTDQYGNIQNYYSTTCPRTADNTPIPQYDEHYNLTKSKQILSGKNEISKIYDYSNAAVLDNYIQLRLKPERWETRFRNFFVKNNNGEYEVPEEVTIDEYILTTSKPAKWENSFSSYTLEDGSPVEGVESIKYIKYPMGTKPPSWNSDYMNYYLYDGISNYSAVGMESVPIYTVQNAMPSDWNLNYENYYYFQTGGYEKLSFPRPKFEKNKYYKRTQYGTEYAYTLLTSIPSDWDQMSYSEYYKRTESRYVNVKLVNNKVPTWKNNTYYSKESFSTPPTWQKTYQYYIKTISSSAPDWQENMYYFHSVSSTAPAFESNIFYELKHDNYHDLVENGVKKLKEYWQNTNIDVNFDPTTYEYDVGDIVGAKEEMTGIFVSQYISKKIVTIVDNVINIKYEIGG